MTGVPVTRPGEVARRLRSGVAIPAHPLALDADGRFDEKSQAALTRYYRAAGAHGLAVGVHTTQFALHDDPGLLRTVWSQAAELAGADQLLVAGLVGPTPTAVAEAETAAGLGYRAALLSGVGTAGAGEDDLLDRARAVAEVLPVIGFYLQDAVGGRRLSADYWRRLFEIPGVVGVKAAPFDRYRTADVVGALLESDRWNEVALLTGNDDTIVWDLLTPFRRAVGDEQREVWFHGGLLGQWAVGTRAAVELLAAIITTRERGADRTVTGIAGRLVEVNAAVFDVEHNFAGCVAGVNEVLRQQGLIRSARSLGDAERLSPGQAEQIALVRARHPNLLDEAFLAELTGG